MSGNLFLVIDSGAGAQMLVDGAAERLGGTPGIVFPRRIITSSSDTPTEVYQRVTPAQFEDLRRRGALSLVWGSGGRNFALPASIDADLAAGCAVVAAAGFGALGGACTRYRGVMAILTPETDETTLRAALACCGDVARLNSPRPAAAIDELVDILRAARPHLLPRRPALPELRQPLA